MQKKILLERLAESASEAEAHEFWRLSWIAAITAVLKAMWRCIFVTAASGRIFPPVSSVSVSAAPPLSR